MDRCKLRTSVTWPGFGMIVLLLASGLFLPFSSEAVITTRVSVASDGTEGNDHSFPYSSISADGRFVAFDSDASNLVPGDTNGKRDIFIHDRQTGQTTRVSVASDGTEGNDHSYYPSISADGRIVAFGSYTSNFVPGDTNGMDDGFVHDRQTGQTTRVSVAKNVTQGNSSAGVVAISGDGRFVAFYDIFPVEVYVHDRWTGQSTRIGGSLWSGGSTRWLYTRPSISGDGRFVAYESFEFNANQRYYPYKQFEILVHDRQTGQTTCVSVASDGTQENDDSYNPSISADGRFAAFSSDASNLVPGDTNGMRDIFVSRAYIRDATTTTATNMTENSATINGIIFPNGSATTYYFEWGTTQAYGNVTGSQSAGSGSGDVAVSANLTGLTPNKAYHYRLVAVNNVGATSYGSDRVFRTRIAGGDLNGDGKADILWRHAVSGQIYLWLMDGISPAGQGTIETVDPSWEIVGAGDFNGDGKADILWRHATTGHIYIWLMDGTTITSRVSPWTVGDLSWVIKGVRDFNGDGKADILWQHNASGQIFVWLMDGTGISSVGSPGTVPDLGWGIRN